MIIAGTYALKRADVCGNGVALVCWELNDAKKASVENWKGVENLLKVQLWCWWDVYDVTLFGCTWCVGETLNGEPLDEKSAMDDLFPDEPTLTSR